MSRVVAMCWRESIEAPLAMARRCTTRKMLGILTAAVCAWVLKECFLSIVIPKSFIVMELWITCPSILMDVIGFLCDPVGRRCISSLFLGEYVIPKGERLSMCGGRLSSGVT